MASFVCYIAEIVFDRNASSVDVVEQPTRLNNKDVPCRQMKGSIHEHR